MSYKQLAEIQKKLKAPKGQFNSYGNYKYRSCEDICEAVKPLLAEIGAALLLNDDIVMVGDRFYVKAIARIVFADGYEVSTTAFAREELTKKGMDAAQITGSCSSYARKYALNGLLCIDDTKDPDTRDNREQNEFAQWCKKNGIPEADFCRFFNITSVDKMDEQRIEYFKKEKDLVRKIKGGK